MTTWRNRDTSFLNYWGHYSVEYASYLELQIELWDQRDFVVGLRLLLVLS